MSQNISKTRQIVRFVSSKPEIEVKTNRDGTFEIVSGHHRLAALSELGLNALVIDQNGQLVELLYHE